MAKAKKTEDVKRGPGRPPAMPGETMTNHMVRVAEDVPALIGELAEARGVSRGALVTQLVRQAATRSANARKANKAKRTASAAAE